MLQEFFGGRPGPYVIGHRGACGYAPENTMVSFERAIALRADAIELDIHPTSDGELVVIHDAALNRTTSGQGLVSAHSLEQIRALDAGSWFDPSFRGERVPVLREVLDWACHRVKVVIEIKAGPIFYQGIEKRLIEVVDEAGMRSEVLIISFDHHCLRRVKQLAPDIATGVLYAGRPLDPARLALDAGADALLPHWGLITRDEVTAAHEANLFIAPWGGPEQDFRHILAQGVDAVSADFPDRPRLLMEAESGA